MKRIISTWYSEKLATQRFFTGLVYELEDSTYIVTAQDGYIQPMAIYTAEQLAEQEARSVATKEEV